MRNFLERCQGSDKVAGADSEPADPRVGLVDFRFDPSGLVGDPVRLPPCVRELVGEDPRLPAGPPNLRQPVHIQVDGGVNLGQVTA